MGKGDERRPTVVDDETFQERWDKAFGKDTRERRWRERHPLPEGVERQENAPYFRKTLTCATCDRSHRSTRNCCYECEHSKGAVHSIGCDATWEAR